VVRARLLTALKDRLYREHGREIEEVGREVGLEGGEEGRREADEVCRCRIEISTRSHFHSNYQRGLPLPYLIFRISQACLRQEGEEGGLEGGEAFSVLETPWLLR